MPIILDGTTGITTPGITNTGTFVFQGPVQVPAGSAATASITTAAGANTGIYFPSSSSVAITTAGTQRFVVSASGDVGIGTSSPQTRLEANQTGVGSVVIPIVAANQDTSSTGTGAGIGFVVDGVNDVIGAQVAGIRTGSAYHQSALTMYTRDSAGGGLLERVRVDSAGNLGLGVVPSAWNTYTASQVQQLAVASYTNGDGRITNNAYYNSGWKYIGNNYAVAYNLDAGGGAHKWFTAASGTAGNTISFTQAMTLDASGQLGIGTTSPGALLHVYTGVQESVRFARNSTNSSAYVTFYANNSSSAQVQYAGILGDVASSTAGSHGGNLLFYTTGSGTSAERARITSDGNLVIGATSTSRRLQVNTSLSTAYDSGNMETTSLSTRIVNTDGTTGNYTGIHFATSNNSDAAIAGVRTADAAMAITFGTRGVGSGNIVERARITSDGEYFYNCTGRTGDAPNVAGGRINEVNGNEKVRVPYDNQVCFQFYSPTGGTSGPVGTININAGSVSYNTTSDVRLKKNIENALDAGYKFDALRVCQFDWKTNGDHVDYGFIAQELNEIVPDAVSKPMNPDEMWGVDYSKLVPMLVKEIQSLRARLAAAGI